MRAVVCLLLVLLPGLAGAVLLPVIDTRPLAAEAELRLRMEAGRIELRAGNEPQVRLEGELAPGTRLRWQERVGGLALLIETPARLRPSPAVLRLVVPSSARLRLDVGDAEVLADGVGAGGLHLRGGRGDLQVQGGPGLRDLRIESTSGAIRIELPQAGRVRAESVAGRIELRLGSAEGAEVRLESFTGPLALHLPPGLPARLRLRQAQGPLLLPEEARLRPDGDVDLGEGEGGGRITLQSFSGPVQVLADPIVQRTSP